MAITIMAVDDEPQILELIKNILEPLGCQILGFTDSQEAARIAESRKIDGAFIDVRMPRMDGFQLTQAIRNSKTNGRIPIVMLTGLDDAETMRRGFKAGITFFLAKPVSNERLVSLFSVMRGPILTEKRRYARLPFRVTATCSRQGKSFKQGTINLSEGGMLLESTPALEVGQEIEIEFSLPQIDQMVKAGALVLRSHPRDGIGIKFLGLSHGDRESIERFISGAM